jgi:hypothetical protein
LDLYRHLLTQLDSAKIYDQLRALGPLIVLTCWETAADCHAGKTYCHRHLVAQWLEDQLRIEVLEVAHPKLDRFAFLRKHGIQAPDYKDLCSRHTQTTAYL